MQGEGDGEQGFLPAQICLTKTNDFVLHSSHRWYAKSLQRQGKFVNFAYTKLWVSKFFLRIFTKFFNIGTSGKPQDGGGGWKGARSKYWTEKGLQGGGECASSFSSTSITPTLPVWGEKWDLTPILFIGKRTMVSVAWSRSHPDRNEHVDQN